MKKVLYTLEEIHRYADDIRQTDKDFWAAINHHDVEAKNQLHAQIQVMREVLLYMHESLEKYGPYRPGLLARMFTHHKIDREVEISGSPLQEIPLIKLDTRNIVHKKGSEL